MLSCGLILLAFVAGPAQKVGRMEHPAIREASGIVASRQYPGIFWVHNDSGNPPSLFAIRRDGSLVREYRVGVPNVDWEDIAADDSGHLYLADLGDNLHQLPFHAIHRFDEPDPSQERDAPLTPSKTIFFSYADGEKRDAESLVIRGHEGLIIAKYRDGRPADLFAVSLTAKASLLPARASRRSLLPGATEAVTGADLSPDGRWLAICSTHQARVFSVGADSSWVAVSAVECPGAQVEGIAWDGLGLILADETRDLYAIAEADWRPEPRTRP